MDGHDLDRLDVLGNRHIPIRVSGFLIRRGREKIGKAVGPLALKVFDDFKKFDERRFLFRHFLKHSKDGKQLRHQVINGKEPRDPEETIEILLPKSPELLLECLIKGRISPLAETELSEMFYAEFGVVCPKGLIENIPQDKRSE